MINALILFRSRLKPQDQQDLDRCRFLTSAIRGFVQTYTVSPAASPIKTDSRRPSFLTLVSRLSCRRAGTRFNSRGIDDDGNVANFVETETIFCHSSGLCFSYIQVRGSVPVFWEQSPGLIPGQQKIQITRSPEATQPAFDEHFEDLELTYGAVHILNLLSESKPGEVQLTSRYSYHVSRCPLNQVIAAGGMSGQRTLRDSQFDFHAETKGPGGYEAAKAVRHMIHDYAESFAYFLCHGDANERSSGGVTRESMVVLQQEGVFRTNCLDCLDRTNLIQTIISQMALEAFFSHRGEHALADFWVRHSTIWAENGDALSRIYTGTGALGSSFTRHGKMSLAGTLADVRKSAKRMYIDNFADKDRQNTIDMLLGRLIDQSPVLLYDPLGEYVNGELDRMINEYSTAESINIWVGTFNLNGRGHGVNEDLSPWLRPELNRLQLQPEIVAVGFQELVELSPQQVMSTDPTRRQVWEEAVGRTLNDKLKGSPEEYILLRSGQLVGAALMIYVKAKALQNVKNVEGSIKKTGMSGIAGNKGAVAIRIEYANTSICFVTAHMAAGFANYEERNRDFHTINHGLRFQRGRSIEDHKSVIWLGDFNYRIGLSNDKVHKLIHAGDLETLYANDQLNLQMIAGRTFPYYSEARITFMPTYKYDLGVDTYDSSEKARIPAWTDRVLRKGDNLRQVNYTSAPLRFSDHRPVFATFQCEISRVDEVRKERLAKDLYARRSAALGHTPVSSKPAHTKLLPTGTTTKNRQADKLDDDDDDSDTDLLDFSPSVVPSLPHPSSDRNKWWLANNQPAKSNIRPPNASAIPNPRRPVNPFTPSPEPDWVTVSRPIDTSTVTSSDTTDRDSSTALDKEIFKVPPISAAAGGGGAAAEARKFPPPFVVGKQQQQQQRRQRHEREAQTYPAAAPSSALPIHRKPAPPVPNKPALLHSTSTELGNNSPSTTRSPPPLPPPRRPSRTGISSSSGATARNLMDDDDDDDDSGCGAGSLGEVAALRPERRA